VRHYYAQPSSAEARYIGDALSKGDLAKYESILLVYPDQFVVFERSRLDEFGALTSSSKAHRVPQMITLIQTIPEEERGGPLSLSFAAKEEFRGAGEKTLVIDLTWMHGMYREASSPAR
jgi:hypothetical protein